MNILFENQDTLMRLEFAPMQDNVTGIGAMRHSSNELVWMAIMAVYSCYKVVVAKLAT